jgi:hypothetical protein
LIPDVSATGSLPSTFDVSELRDPTFVFGTSNLGVPYVRGVRVLLPDEVSVVVFDSGDLILPLSIPD